MAAKSLWNPLRDLKPLPAETSAAVGRLGNKSPVTAPILGQTHLWRPHHKERREHLMSDAGCKICRILRICVASTVGLPLLVARGWGDHLLVGHLSERAWERHRQTRLRQIHKTLWVCWIWLLNLKLLPLIVAYHINAERCKRGDND